MSWAQGDENYYATQDTYMDIDHEYEKNENTWKGKLHFLVMMTILVGMITDPTITILMCTSKCWL